MASDPDRKKKGLLFWIGLAAAAAFVLGGGYAGIRYLIAKNTVWTVTVLIKGPQEAVLECGEDFEDPGALALLSRGRLGKEDVAWEAPVSVSGSADPMRPGSYSLLYQASCMTREKAFPGLNYEITGSAVRTVVYRDTTAPALKLKGELSPQLPYGETYREEGFEASDLVDGDLTGKVEVLQEGERLLYSVRDSSGNETRAERNIRRIDVEAPVLHLVGEAQTELNWDAAYQEEGCLAFDAVEGDLTDKVERTEYEDRIVYRVADSSGNTAEVIRTLRYVDRQAPVLTLEGQSFYSINVGEDLKVPGCTAWDDRDGDLTDRIKVEGRFIRYEVGTQIIRYTVSDEAGNEASVTRTIDVKPVATLPAEVWPSQKTIYLTFDDGPGGDTERVLDILARQKVKATFFVCNTKQRSLIAKIAEQGHALGIHCGSHYYNVIYASDEAYFKDFFSMREVIRQYSGQYVNILRFPGGSSNISSKQYCQGLMTRVTRSLEAMGFKYFDWNAAAGDSGGNASTEQVFERITTAASQKGTVVVLMHENYPNTVMALEDIIKWGKENGFAFSALDMTSPGMHQPLMN